MQKFYKSNLYIVIKNIAELKKAKEVDLCRYIIFEESNIIYIWERFESKWIKYKYVAFGEDNNKNEEITGYTAYQEFYRYCGKEKVELMKTILDPIELWESYEQMHYYNVEYANVNIYKDIYEFDANSAFTYGSLMLPDEFDKLKEYMLLLYDKKANATKKDDRNKYKNLQNFLIGYFAKIKEFVRVRSEIIKNSNDNIKSKMFEIVSNKGIVYLSNTDSIVTDKIGADIMSKYIGNEVGKFKINTVTDRLVYLSSNAYQLGNKVVYSGVPYFARKELDLFEGIWAKQSGKLIECFDFNINDFDHEEYLKLCRVRKGKIKVEVKNILGELIKEKEYILT